MRAPNGSIARPECTVADSTLSDRHLRRMSSTRALTRGLGVNAPRGTGRPSDVSNVRDQRRAPGAATLAHRRAAASWTMRCAVTSRLPGCSSRFRIGLVKLKGGFATTWYGRRGRRRSAASAQTTTASSPNSARSWATRRGCRSTAMTRQLASSSPRVIEPVPAPMSTTRAAAGNAASATIRAAHVGSSAYQSQRCAPTDTHRRHERCHRWQVYPGDCELSND